MNILHKLLFMRKHWKELEEAVSDICAAREAEELNANRYRLHLCFDHRQEERQAHYAKHNCDHCKALRRIATLEGAL